MQDQKIMHHHCDLEYHARRNDAQVIADIQVRYKTNTHAKQLTLLCAMIGQGKVDEGE